MERGTELFGRKRIGWNGRRRSHDRRPGVPVRPSQWSTLGGMPEVSSISVSSYDPESLAPLLTEHVNDGWEVLGIVTAGTKIVAYLQREGAAPADENGASRIDPLMDRDLLNRPDHVLGRQTNDGRRGLLQTQI